MVIHKHSSAQIREIVEECLRFLAGEKFPDQLTDEMNVLQICGLDSEHGLEIACDLSAKLGFEIPNDDNPLVYEDRATGRKRGRSLPEVIEHIEELQNSLS